MARIWNVLNRDAEYVGLVTLGRDGKYLPVYSGATFTRQPTKEDAVRVIELASGQTDLLAAQRSARMTVEVHDG